MGAVVGAGGSQAWASTVWALKLVACDGGVEGDSTLVVGGGGGLGVERGAVGGGEVIEGGDGVVKWWCGSVCGDGGGGGDVAALGGGDDRIWPRSRFLLLTASSRACSRSFPRTWLPR